MARKRGGLAGIWDRNKGVIQKVAPAALSFVPGVGIPLAAAAGAAMRGLDRPGKSGIGFDVGQGIRGGLEGAAIAGTTQAIAGGVKGLANRKMQEMFDRGYGQAMDRAKRESGDFAERYASMRESFGAAGGAPGAIGGASPATAIPGSSPAASIRQMLAPSTGGAPAPSAGRQLLEGIGDRELRSLGAAPGAGGGRTSQFLSGLRENKDLLTAAGRGIQSALPQRESQSDIMAAETGRMNAETQRRFSEFQMQQTQEQQQREEERRRAILQFLSPYIRQNAPMLNPGAFGDLG